MKVIIDIPDTLGRKVYKIVEKGNYPDLSTFFLISAENFVLEKPWVQSGENDNGAQQKIKRTLYHPVNRICLFLFDPHYKSLPDLGRQNLLPLLLEMLVPLVLYKNLILAEIFLLL